MKTQPIRFQEDASRIAGAITRGLSEFETEEKLNLQADGIRSTPKT
jgi:hypothetical protein